MSATYPSLGNDFPDAKDTMTRMSDLNYANKSLADRYYTYINAGNFTAAQQLLSDNPTLDSMILNAAKINRFNDIALSLEWFFKDNVDGYIQTKQSEFSAYVDGKENVLNGKVSDTVAYIDGKQNEFDTYVDDFRYLGDYNNSVSYVKKNIVYFSGYTYICRIPSNGVSPIVNETTANWGLISKKGDKGDQGVSGTGLSPRGQWDSAITYYKDDMVIDNENMWQCIVENINSKPSTSNTSWLKMIIDANIVIVSSAQPSNQYVGCLWMKEV